MPSRESEGYFAPIAHSALGLAALQEFSGDEAARHLSQALVLARGRGAKALVAECLYGTAAVAAMHGDPERANRLWGAADAVKEETGMPLSIPEKLIVELYLGPAQSELASDIRVAAKAEGSAMSLDAAIAYALGEAA